MSNTICQHFFEKICTMIQKYDILTKNVEDIMKKIRKHRVLNGELILAELVLIVVNHPRVQPDRSILAAVDAVLAAIDYGYSSFVGDIVVGVYVG